MTPFDLLFLWLLTLYHIWSSFSYFFVTHQLYHNTHKYWDSATNKMNFSESIELTAGTYYFLVECESTGNYDFSITSDANKPTEPTTDPDTKPGTDPKPSRILGDVDGDKSVKIKDATLIQKYLADIYTGYDIGSEF